MHAEFGLLGPLEVWIDGRELELRRPKQRALLALLLLRVGEVVSTDRLIDELWAGKPPKAALGSLQNLVSELRKQLGAETVKTRAPGYLLDVEPDRVDLHRFERLVASAAETGDVEGRAAKLRDALALWRGPALADLAFEPFAQVEIARLEERRTAAREDLIDAELELGGHGRLVGELEALVREHPLRERLRAQLMLALYRAGRQAEALEAYRQARETLVDELGIEPSEDLQQLEQAILRQDRQLDLPTRTVAAPPEPDRRKTVTILFTDVVDSTGLGAELDPEVMRSVMGRYFDTVRTIVERHGGTVEKFIGDAAMTVFGIPKLHEDDALRAVRAAGELRESLVELNAELGSERGVVIQLRTGVNTGEVLASEADSGESSAAGSVVGATMRLEQAALPGEILLGEKTFGLVRDAVEAEPVGPIDLGGALGKVKTFRLLRIGETEGASTVSVAPFVGRSTELAWLRTAFARVRDERRSRVVTILGEAGVGKTRLVSELVSSLGDEGTSLVGRCVSYGEGATFLPLAEIVKQAVPKRPERTIAALLEGDENAVLIAERVTQLTGESESTTSTGEVFWAVRRFLEALSAERPAVVVLEDVHWAEPTLLELVEYLAAWTVEGPLLVVCIARPELREARPGWGADADVLELEPLVEADAEALVGVLGGTDIAPEMRTRIVESAEGNPLFVEQLLAYLEEAGPEALDAVPPSVEAVLASRLDRLEPEEGALLERAAVAGRTFTRGTVVHLTPPNELAGADRRLMSLVRRGLIHAVRSRSDREDGFRFHHVLIRDVAYAGITKEARGGLHELVAAWLEQREEGAEEIVGYHLEQAHRFRIELRPGDPELAELAQRAGERLGTAGIRAWKRADTPATVNLLGRAAGLLPPESDDRAELLCELGIAQRWAGEIERAEETLAEAIETAASARDRRVVLRARIERAHIYLFTDKAGGSAELLELAEKAIPIFEELGDDRSLGRTWRHVGYVHGGMEGRLAEWQACAERALIHYRRSGWSVSGCLAELAACLFHGPTPVSEALHHCDDLLNETTDRAGKANVLGFMGGLTGLDGRVDEAWPLIAEATAIYEEIGETYALANNSGRVRSRLELLAGNARAAEQTSRDCCATFEQVNDQSGLSTQAAELAEALYAQARYDEADGWAGVAEQRAPGDDLIAQFSWRRVRAKLLAREGSVNRAEELALDAAQLSSRTDALSERGNTLLDLAEVLCLANRSAEASPRVEEALAFFERKGNVVSAGAARSMLDELAVA